MLSYAGEIAGTEDDLLYQTARCFPTRRGAGYRIPLPPGRYQVSLHFAEIWFRTRGQRIFDVRIEEEVIQDYEPLAAGFATAQVKTVTVSVNDGLLDIQFVHRKDNPVISALEIERVE